MDHGTTAIEPPPPSAPPTFGLHHGALGPLETLAQSISTMAPTTSPAMTVPLVFASAGNGTWLAYLIALCCTLLIALCISRFARESASPGSLYSYATGSLPPALSSMAAWALLIAYIGTGASVIGGFVHYTNVVLSEFSGRTISGLLLCLLGVGLSTAVAYRDVKISARLMVWIELASVLLISAVFAMVLWRRGLHVDSAQLTLRGVRWSGVRLGVVLAMFSFVGFESATTLGEEARHPLRTIPRAVVGSALLSGLFFLAASYTEVLGFPASAGTLDQSPSPLSAIAAAAGAPRFGPLIDIAATVSMFACTLACVTAAGRVLLMMAHNGIAPHIFTRTHRRNGTPHTAIVFTGAATLLLSAGLVLLHTPGETIYDWMGSLATYGFVTVYALVAIALPLRLRAQGRLSAAAVILSAASVLAMALILEGTLYPVPELPKNYLPYLFLVYLAAGTAWGAWHSSRRAAGQGTVIPTARP